MKLRGIPCTIMRGGSSKGLYFDARDLPADRATRDAVLLAAMGSPDARQIDGLGGAHPLTSKVAVIGRSADDQADVDYLFLQVAVDSAKVSDSQNCGNILAGVGPWAIENGLVTPRGETTAVRIRMLNTGSLAVAHVPTADGSVEYEGQARIDGVPGSAAAIALEFLDIAGSSCGALLPTGAVKDRVDGVEATCVDNGMPVVMLRAADFGKTGAETPTELEADAELKSRVEGIRLALGPRMNLGDVAGKTVPKMALVSRLPAGVGVATRTFIPHRVHEAIGVLGALSVATGCLLAGSVAGEIAGVPPGRGARRVEVAHPSGSFTVELEVEPDGEGVRVRRSALLRTARKLMRGEVYVSARVWNGT
jgi:4-oxalomesaconate tautomerase